MKGLRQREVFINPVIQRPGAIRWALPMLITARKRRAFPQEACRRHEVRKRLLS